MHHEEHHGNSKLDLVDQLPGCFTPWSRLHQWRSLAQRGAQSRSTARPPQPLSDTAGDDQRYRPLLRPGVHLGIASNRSHTETCRQRMTCTGLPEEKTRNSKRQQAMVAQKKQNPSSSSAAAWRFNCQERRSAHSNWTMRTRRRSLKFHRSRWCVRSGCKTCNGDAVKARFVAPTGHLPLRSHCWQPSVEQSKTGAIACSTSPQLSRNLRLMNFSCSFHHPEVFRPSMASCSGEHCTVHMEPRSSLWASTCSKASHRDRGLRVDCSR